MPTDAKQPTPRTRDLVALVDAMSTRDRRPPTYRELAAGMRVSVPRIQALLNRAQACGLVTLEYRRARSIRVIEQPKANRRQRADCA